jgi:hypothetical protein
MDRDETAGWEIGAEGPHELIDLFFPFLPWFEPKLTWLVTFF